MPVSIESELNNIRRVPVFGSYLVRVLTKLQQGINQVATNAAVDTSTLPAPDPLGGVNVSSDGSNLVHVTLTDNNPLQKNVGYFVEHADNPAFQNAYPEYLGPARGRILNLPQGTHYIRAFHQAPGSLPSTPVNFGGSVPTAVVVSSGSSVTLLPSRGSGTSSPSGGQPGQGFGVTLNRPAPGPKRTSGKLGL